MPAPIFADPVPLALPLVDREAINEQIKVVFRSATESRTGWNDKHTLYDDMFRGRTPPRQGPWEGAADLHIQMPYWLIDSVNVRLSSTLWEQVPLVTAIPYEDDDEEKGRDVAQLVSWHLSPQRMRGRALWNRASKIRLTHGVGLIYLTAGQRTATHYENSVDETTGEAYAEPVQRTAYEGPVMTPLEWDDFVVWPTDAVNVQPRDATNPKGAVAVALRQWMHLSQLRAMASAMPYLFDGERDEAWWRANAPAQDRSGADLSAQSNTRTRQQDQHDGFNRSQAGTIAQAGTLDPEYEIITYFGQFEDPATGEMMEMVVFKCVKPDLVLGAYPLGMLYYTNQRPLVELHYQTVGMQYYSMGIPEIVQHLSAELDTIHNMRIDVGFATNLPYFFYADTMSLEPSEIVLRPFSGIPVSDPNGIRFPQVGNVTSFYLQEEQQLYSLIERVVGVTDLFLGISPTRGAAARHATGFVGTQQESLARTSEIIAQDAEAFSTLAKLVYAIDMQYGPEYRAFRLLGRTPSAGIVRTRDQLWMEGEYDFTLGANQGTYAQQIEQQRAQAVLQLAMTSPLSQQDPGRIWSASERYLLAQGVHDPERYIGPKAAVARANPKPQDEENGEMVQFFYGEDAPAPVHPDDDDEQHMRELLEFVDSEVYRGLETPNLNGFMAHYQMHEQQASQKRQMMAMQQMQQAAGPPPGATGGGPPGQQDRMLAGMMNQGSPNAALGGQAPPAPAPAPTNPNGAP